MRKKRDKAGVYCILGLVLENLLKAKKNKTWNIPQPEYFNNVGCAPNKQAMSDINLLLKDDMQSFL